MKNKIFQLGYLEDIDVICAPTEEEAKDHCAEENGIDISEIYSCIEIPESEWDKTKIKIWEDNDINKKPYFITYRDAYTNVNIETISSTNIDWL